jgi:hypothetical protein
MQKIFTMISGFVLVCCLPVLIGLPFLDKLAVRPVLTRTASFAGAVVASTNTQVGLTTGTFGNQPGTSFEEPPGFATEYIDTGDPAVEHVLENNPGQPSVFFPGSDTELGFQITYTPTRAAGSGSDVGLTDGDLFGVSNDDAGLAFPVGAQGLRLGDTDGRVRVVFDPVDFSGVASRFVSWQINVPNTTYEASNGGIDTFRVYLEVLEEGQPDIELIAGPTGFPFFNSWVSVNSIVEIPEAIVRLVIEVDYDEEAEYLLVDNIQFSGGVVNSCIADLRPPEITCPTDTIVGAEPGFCDIALAEPVATAVDNCTEAVPIQYQNRPQFFPLGETVVTATATDASGNAASCEFSVTVNDVEPPILTCQSETVLLDGDPTTCSYAIPAAENQLGLPQLLGDCTETTFVNDLTGTAALDDVVFAVGDTSFYWIATDVAGNSDSCQVTVRIVDTAGNCTTSLGEAELALAHWAAYPNPFYQQTTLEWTVADPRGRVQLEVIDRAGRLVKTLPTTPATRNRHRVQWNGTDNAGNELPAGMYFLRIRSNGKTATRKVLRLR